MLIYVKNLTGRTITLNVEPLHTIKDVKDQIEKKEGIYVEQFRLLFARKIVCDHRKVYEYNIQNESTIHMVLAPNPTWNYNSNPCIGSSLKQWNARKDLTIFQFKSLYTNLDKELLVSWMCRQHYYNNTKTYSFPLDIIKLIATQIKFEVKEYDPKEFEKTKTSKLFPKRIRKEIQRLTKNKAPGINITINPNNYRYFLVEMEGTKNTPYEGGIFHGELFLTKTYPMEPPKFRFLTPIIHPNVFPCGRVYLEELKQKWTPALTIIKLILRLQSIFTQTKPFFWKPTDENFDIDKEAREATIKYAFVKQ